MKYKLLILQIIFWAIIPIGTIWTAHLAIEKHSIYMLILVLINCHSITGMIINYEDYTRIIKTKHPHQC